MSFPKTSLEKLRIDIYFDEGTTDKAFGKWTGYLIVDLAVGPKSGHNNVVDYGSPDNLKRIKEAVFKGLSGQLNLAAISRVEITSMRIDSLVARMKFTDPSNPTIY